MLSAEKGREEPGSLVQICQDCCLMGAFGTGLQDGVCNKYGQAHDVANLFISDGSQFTTGGAENPTLTIVALAIRQADYLADQLRKNQM
jgi:choline dehydrogenase-like flavoprotein